MERRKCRKAPVGARTHLFPLFYWPDSELSARLCPRVLPASHLYSHLNCRHDRIAQDLHTILERRLAAWSITVSQWSVMILLYHRDADTVRDIARIIDLDAGAISRLADRLEKKGYLRRTPDLSNRRSVLFRNPQR